MLNFLKKIFKREHPRRFKDLERGDSVYIFNATSNDYKKGRFMGDSVWLHISPFNIRELRIDKDYFDLSIMLSNQFYDDYFIFSDYQEFLKWAKYIHIRRSKRFHVQERRRRASQFIYKMLNL